MLIDINIVTDFRNPEIFQKCNSNFNINLVLSTFIIVLKQKAHLVSNPLQTIKVHTYVYVNNLTL